MREQPVTCPACGWCGHSLDNNSHGYDQGDIEGRCKYCRICMGRSAVLDELGPFCRKCKLPAMTMHDGVCLTCDPTGGGCLGGKS